MITNMGKLMGLTKGNCKVVDISTTLEEKDKIFALIRRSVKYSFDVDFEKLILNKFIPVKIHKFGNKDEIVIKFKGDK